MTINEAKICLSIQIEVKHRLGKDYEATALQLGLEALQRVESNEFDRAEDKHHKLPSETLAK